LSPTELDEAYNKPFIGSAAIDFVKFLPDIDDGIQGNTIKAYAKVISVLQSSGTGKSRMLIEVRPYSVDRHHLTESLFRLTDTSSRFPSVSAIQGLQAPSSDKDVYGYFELITKDNDMSLTAHSAIARFLTAAHGTMLKWLKEEQQRSNFDEERPREWWHPIMEQRARREERQKFFTEMLDNVKTVSQPIPLF
jgi:hypothetical protein